jgi:hypothetical protein
MKSQHHSAAGCVGVMLLGDGLGKARLEFE